MLTLKQKQKRVLEAVNDPKIHTIVLIGSVGTGKTDIAAHVGLSIAYNFPKTYWTVFRQNISTAKRSVIPSYLNMAELMNLYEGIDYRYNKNEFEFTILHNKSKIGFIEADVTKDRQGRKIKGINATANHVDEADELAETMFTMATARKGRRNDTGQPSISIITMNPNDTYLREKYYEPWKAGTLDPGVIVIEFTIEDSWQTKEDIEQMMSNPKPWVERYLKNNWNYQDDDLSLFKYIYFQKAIVSLVDVNAKRTMGVDVARSGTDRSVVAIWYGNVLTQLIIIKDKTEKKTTDEQAMEVIKIMSDHSILAENVAVDAVGVGVGVIDHMKSKGINVKEFTSGAVPIVEYNPDGSPKPKKYDNLRSQVIWTFSQGLEKEQYKISDGCALRNDLISEAMAHLHEVTDKVMSVESKDKVKERTGSLSPDIFDAVVMGLYPQLKIDPKNDTNRIIF